MIIFYGEGRLGNQIFQYHALNSITVSGEIIVASGLEELPQSFELHGARLIIISKSGFLKRLIKYVIIPALLRPLAKTLRLFNYVHETIGGVTPNTGATGEIQLRHGLIGSISFVDGGYYQNPALWRDLFPTRLLSLRESLRNKAHQYLQQHVPVELIPVFIHIRRGDYLGYSSYGLSSLVLPETFYRRAIHMASERLHHVQFVFVTDDPAWVANTFGTVPHKTIVSTTADLDFAIMAICRGGILSNSTFSLGAAFMLDQPDIVIAPQYWFGFRVNAWYPPRIQAPHERITYIPVLDQST